MKGASATLKTVVQVDVRHLGLLEELKLDARFADGNLSFLWNDRAEQVQLQQVGRAIYFDEDVGCNDVMVSEGSGAGKLYLHTHDTVRLAPAKLWSQWHCFLTTMIVHA